MNILSKGRIIAKDKWEYVHRKYNIDCDKSAIIICDVWDKHWDLGAEKRMNVLAQKINDFIKIATALGMTIIHSPHDTDTYYSNHPCFIPERYIDPSIDIIDPLSIWNVYHRIESPIKPVSKQYETKLVWTMQNSAIEINDSDYISTDSYRIFGLLKSLNVENIFYVGCHLNACIMWRPLGVIQAKHLYYNVFFIEELIDILYDVTNVPYINHEQALVVIKDFIRSFFTDSVSTKEFTI